MLWDLRPQPRNQRLPREDSNLIVHGLLEIDLLRFEGKN